MTRRTILTFGAGTALAFAMLPGSAIAQQKSLKDQIVGTWALVSWEQTRADGSKFKSFGDSPKGVNTYDANGRFSLIIMRPDLPKLASGNRQTATPEEAKAIMGGSIAYFGTYTVNEADKVVSLRIDATTFPNQLGNEQKRMITAISADEMKYRNPTATSGGQIELAWKRAQ